MGANEYWSAQVPGYVHTDLRRNQRIPDPFWGNNEHQLAWMERTDWEYRRTFDVPAELLHNGRVDLVADGLDTLATIFINGHQVAATENMFIGYRFPVQQFLTPGTNEISVHFANPMEYIESKLNLHTFREWNDPVGGSSNIRKEQCSFGWDWGPRFPTSGIYQDIRLEAWTGNRLADVYVEQHHADGMVLLTVRPELAETNAAVCRAALELNGEVIAHTEGSDELQLVVEHPLLWWPNGLGPQPLYDLKVELLDPNGILDAKHARIGLRTIELDRHADAWGESFQFVVNGVPVFAKGANWIPAHAFVTEVSHADYDALLTSAVEAHMNMLRVWGGGIYEMEAFYDLCDEKGLMV